MYVWLVLHYPDDCGQTDVKVFIMRDSAVAEAEKIRNEFKEPGELKAHNPFAQEDLFCELADDTWVSVVKTELHP
jgi:hypothetical protein